MPEAIEVLNEYFENATDGTAPFNWREVAKILVRLALGGAAVVVSVVAIHLVAGKTEPGEWFSPYAYSILALAISVTYQIGVAFMLRGTVFHLFFRERIVRAEDLSRPRPISLLIRASVFHAPLAMVTLLIAGDLYLNGQMPRGESIVSVLYFLSLLFYGCRYLHADRRAIYDIASGTKVVRS
ncbi:hypothetical protein [Candidatus Poriferisodalis sp.]|uniref:hypothetical protein n=1 Tax=Candidatus Poriferisodalis sp. TaxID=3101277 RepID=UPI003B515F94